jgi:hypothetical protein
MKNPLKWFTQLWHWANKDNTIAVLRRVDDMVGMALPIVRQIAALTPTRTDDEIMALFEQFKVKLDGWLGLPQYQRGAALLHVATVELAKRYPNAPINQLQAAIQLAVTVMKANQ